MDVIHTCSHALLTTYRSIADMRGAKFLGEFDPKDWNMPIPVFYNKEKHPRGSHYFAMYHTSWIPSPFDDLPADKGRWMIMDGGNIENQTYRGFVFPEGIFYSRYRHDYKERDGYTVDGGFDYGRYSIPSTGAKYPYVEFQIKDGKIHELSSANEQTA